MVLESASFEASQRSIMWLRAKLWLATLMSSYFSLAFLWLEVYSFLIRLMIAVHPSFEAM